ncbi:hypothetical protein P5673_011174 [Acropora cervicornis]|uniref:GIY-YIG domain-containing protein n=1 Tax=Acropora cervicornis TaxID=6130 RepID=A0AAD9QQ24_ACRCE|nr:hypothetical protein P5673_011174 [Acropora cervicornis]
MKSFLDKHNKSILKKHTNRLNKDDEKLCNCRQRVNCPTDGKCLTRSVVYKAEVTSTDDNTTQTYIGVTANDFKTRYRNHLKSLRNEKYKHETELSKHVWNLKKENRQFSIRCAIVKQTPAGRNGKRNCALCLEEKLMIMKGRSKNILNRRSEMFTKCRHEIAKSIGNQIPWRSMCYAPLLRHVLLEYSDKVNDDHLAAIVAVCRGTLFVKDYYGQVHIWKRTPMCRQQGLVEHCIVGIAEGDLNNNIAEHHLKTNHAIDWDFATCLTYSTDYYQRITLESWFTNLEQTALNRCQPLPAPYKRLLNRKQ